MLLLIIHVTEIWVKNNSFRYDHTIYNNTRNHNKIGSNVYKSKNSSIYNQTNFMYKSIRQKMYKLHKMTRVLIVVLRGFRLHF